jgi:hypothetical protein
MVPVSLELQGYRNIREPVKLLLGDGNVALIGPNNAGKSNVLRFIFEFRAVFTGLEGQIGNPQVNNAVQGLSDPREYFSRPGGPDFRCRITVGGPLNPNELRTIELTCSREPGASPQPHGHYEDGEVISAKDGQPAGARPSADHSRMSKALEMLRGSRYYGAARTSVATYGSGEHFDLKAGSALIGLWDTWRRGTSLFEDDRARWITEQLKEVFGFEDLSINSNQQGNDLLFEFNGHRQRLSELGFGISQFFTVLLNAARDRPTILMIDEPESNLHASLQLKFFNALNTYCDSVLCSTHSIGLAKQVANRIYSFVPTPTGVRVRDFADPAYLPSQLGELSFSAQREVGYERVLLVEGPTDIQVFQSILQTLGYGSKVVLLNLGGSSNVTARVRPQLEELLRLVRFDKDHPQLAAIVDSERSSESSRNERVEGFAHVLADLEVPCHVLERRAIENYFTSTQLNAARVRLGPIGPYEPLPQNWDKGANFKIASQMTRNEVEDCDFGRFLVNWLRHQ